MLTMHTILFQPPHWFFHPHILSHDISAGCGIDQKVLIGSTKHVGVEGTSNIATKSDRRSSQVCGSPMMCRLQRKEGAQTTDRVVHQVDGGVTDQCSHTAAAFCPYKMLEAKSGGNR